MMSNDTCLEFNCLQRLWWKIRIGIGYGINYCIKPARELMLIEKRAGVLTARSPGNRLTTEEMTRLRQYMLDVQDRTLRCQYFKTTPIERTFQGLLLPLIAKVIDIAPSIRTVVNIGASYAYVDSLLAAQYPQIKFIGVDFAVNLAEYNAEFAHQNLTFRSGYALEMLENDELPSDVYFFGNAAYEIKNLELRYYFSLFKKQGAKFVVLNEPIYPLPGGAVVDPLQVPLNNSMAVYSHQRPDNRHGPLGRVHNYKAMLEEAGFNVIYYRVFRPDFTDLRVVHVIAQCRTEC